VYMAATSETDLFTISGITSTNGIIVEGKTVTVPNSALNQNSIVTVSDNYTLKLADDVKKTSTTAAGWRLNGNIATYNNSEVLAGYKVENNQISYVKGSGGETLVTVKGVESTDGLSIKDKVVTVAKSSLGTDKVTVSSGYTLKLADDVPKTETKKAAWTLDGTTATYKSSYKTEGYSLAKNSKSISHTEPTEAKNLATIKGAASTKGLSVSDKKITLKKSALNSKVTISGSYEFNFASDYKKATISGSGKADTITTNGSNLSVNGGKGNDTINVLGSSTTVTGGAGNDSIISNGKGGNVFVYNSGDGKDIITDYNENDVIQIASSKINDSQISTDGDDVIFTVGKGSITVTDAADKVITYIDKNGKKQTYPKTVIVSGKTATLLETYSKDDFNVADYGNGIQTIDAKDVPHDISITANKLTNNVIGGAGNDTLNGGKSNDILTGGEGSDVFIYNNGDGNDLITDYTEEDLIKIASGTVSKIVTSGKNGDKNGDKNVIFTVGKGKISVKGGANKIIRYEDAKGVENFYPVKFNPEGTSATLLGDFNKDKFNTEDYGDYAGTLKTIKASAVENDIVITANKNPNKIIGGSGNDTLIGGKGNDILTGGKGSDVFIYASGDDNDVIMDYKEDDIIRITKGTANIEASDKNIIFKVGSGKLTVKNGKDKIITYIDAKGKKNYYPAPTEDSVIINDNKATLLNGYKKSSFDVANYDSKNDPKIKIIDASRVSRNLKIVGNEKANVIISGSGKSTLIGGAGDDSIFGGDGANVYVYNDGDRYDTVYNYGAGDKISLASGKVSNVSVKNDTVIFTVGKGKISVDGGAEKVIMVVDKAGNNMIIGNDAANSLKGGKKNDTLQGGKGNDKLWGNAGADTFIYESGDGKDIIYGFDNKDILQIPGTPSTSLNKSKTEIYFKVDSTKKAITLKDFTATTFNINGSNYKISGSKLSLA
ncbi:MAG: hypothetical protein IKZ53_06970, partial [Selenomonadaceae bacterium]|nr:hypothetical protein [Selenomonadaceae bacterium]